MKPSAKDQVEGTFHEVKGTVKAAAGRVSHNRDLARRGWAEALAGKVQKKVGQIKRAFGK